MPTVRYLLCTACCCAQPCNCDSAGDLYSSDRSCSAACRCGSPVPPNHTSVLGLAFSAINCASASPEPLSDMLILMPVLLANTVWIMLHHSACTEQITFSWPPSCAWAGANALASTKPLAQAQPRIVICPFIGLSPSIVGRW